MLCFFSLKTSCVHEHYINIYITCWWYLQAEHEASVSHFWYFCTQQISLWNELSYYNRRNVMILYDPVLFWHEQYCIGKNVFHATSLMRQHGISYIVIYSIQYTCAFAKNTIDRRTICIRYIFLICPTQFTMIPCQGMASWPLGACTSPALKAGNSWCWYHLALFILK